MYVVGFGGAAGSGKTTAANMLIDIAQLSRHEHIEFSDPIIEAGQMWLNAIPDDASDITSQRSELLKVLGISSINNPTQDDLLTLNEAYARKISEGSIVRNLSLETKTLHRPLLEWIGRSAIQLISPNVWSDIVYSKVSTAKVTGIELVTIGGIRTVADKQVVTRSSGSVVSLHRDGSSNLLSEYQISQWSAEFNVINNGTLSELRHKIENIWCQLKKPNNFNPKKTFLS